MAPEQTQAEEVLAEDPIDDDYKSIEKRTDVDGNGPNHNTVGCARCGDDHKNLSTIAFFRPILDHKDGLAWRWWATCPTTGDPILIANAPE